MDFEAVVDPLFRGPLAAGFLVAAVLPLLGEVTGDRADEQTARTPPTAHR